MKTYLIRVNTIDNLYAEYIVSADNLISAKAKVKKAFFRDYPDADKNIKLTTATEESSIIAKAKKLIEEEINDNN